MTLLDVINSTGDVVTDGLAVATETGGQMFDAALDWIAGRADAVGFEKASDVLRDSGDFIASATGGSVDERDLGQTADPKELIHGEPATIAATAKTLAALAEHLESTCTALGSIDTGTWTGDAATSFQETFSKQRQLWGAAADAMISTAQKLNYWQQTVESAQAKAADAIAFWERAESARQAAVEVDAATDTWTSRYRQAREILTDARSARNEAAIAVASAIAKATSGAPTEPAFTDRMLANLNDAALVTEHGKLSAGKGLVNGLTGIVQFARQINPTDPYNLTHPAQYVASMSGMSAGLSQTLADPAAAASAAWEGVKRNPFEAAGSLLADAAVAAGTGGLGAAASVGRSGIKLIEDVGDASPDGEKAESDQESQSETTSNTSVPGEPVEMQQFEATEFLDAEKSLDHFERHGADFGSTTEAEYVQAARNFLRDAQILNYPAKIDDDGLVRIYDHDSGSFGIFETDGRIVTYYIPSSSTYWERRAPSYGNDVKWVA